jgi:hypothetical protein
MKYVLSRYESSAKDCAEVNALLDTHIEHVTHRIQELNAPSLNFRPFVQAAALQLSECGVCKTGDSSTTSSASTAFAHIDGAH